MARKKGDRLKTINDAQLDRLRNPDLTKGILRDISVAKFRVERAELLMKAFGSPGTQVTFFTNEKGQNIAVGIDFGTDRVIASEGEYRYALLKAYERIVDDRLYDDFPSYDASWCAIQLDFRNALVTYLSYAKERETDSDHTGELIAYLPDAIAIPHAQIQKLIKFTFRNEEQAKRLKEAWA